jgi:hypothetical protein
MKLSKVQDRGLSFRSALPHFPLFTSDVTDSVHDTRAIVELCARRFDIQKMKLSVNVANGLTDIASSLFSVMDFLNRLVAQGKMTQDDADKEMEVEIKGKLVEADRVRLLTPLMITRTFTNLWRRRLSKWSPTKTHGINW